MATPGAYSAASAIEGRAVDEFSAVTRRPYSRQAGWASYPEKPFSDTDARLIFSDVKSFPY
jgi:hypothetical protein